MSRKVKKTYRYKAICHTRCYWLETLWEPGDVYEGDHPANKHFNKTGYLDKDKAPSTDAGSDPRSTEELKIRLKLYGMDIDDKWTRKQIWAKLSLADEQAVKDALTDSEAGMVVAKCGFKARTASGLANHQKSCGLCKSTDPAVKEKYAKQTVEKKDS